MFCEYFFRFFCFIIIAPLFGGFSVLVFAKDNYDSSYVFLIVTKQNSVKSQRYCVNFQQWRTTYIDSSPQGIGKKHLKLGWLGKVNSTKICQRSPFFTCDDNTVVPLDYRLSEEDKSCLPFIHNRTNTMKTLVQYKVNQLMNVGATAGIFLVEKGSNYSGRWPDYLFSEFYDPDVDQSITMPIFFMYKHAFNEILKEFGDGVSSKPVYFTFYRPKSLSWDLSMLIIWLLAVFCVGIGGYWAGHRKNCEEKLGLESRFASSLISAEAQKKLEHDDDKATAPANCLFVVIAMIIVVGILMLGFYFRHVMVYIFNVILSIVGTFSMHRCLSSAYNYFCRCNQCKVCISASDISQAIFKRDLLSNYECCCGRPRESSVLLFIFSAGFCILWFFSRRNPYAFILLDFINVTLCLHVLKWIRFPNLKWLTVLLLCMFVYDMFMVFGTPYLTKSGCSVMIEVAAGTDCMKSNTGYPVAPVSGDIPEKFPMLFQVPRLSDPMLSCIDLEIEKEYRPVILGLGDVIVPGYLISFCFTVDFSAKTRHLYGVVSVVGYSFGLIATFFALTAMESAQPALIYLIPFTLLPIIALSLIRKEFKLLWNGCFTKSEVSDY
uniref:Signal peptide peptidase-like 2B n=1 Tax=Syphacia muris TaxID=451379 RepID=A0A0N5APK8_9BILA